jgi:hypothetical protein
MGLRLGNGSFDPSVDPTLLLLGRKDEPRPRSIAELATNFGFVAWVGAPLRCGQAMQWSIRVHLREDVRGRRFNA